MSTAAFVYEVAAGFDPDCPWCVGNIPADGSDLIARPCDEHTRHCATYCGEPIAVDDATVTLPGDRAAHEECHASRFAVDGDTYQGFDADGGWLEDGAA